MSKNQYTLRSSPTALLNPRSDPSFKAMFTNDTPEARIALADFISAMLGRTVREVEVTTNEPPVDMLNEMQMSFDVAVVFDDGERASIEMQGRNQEYDWSSRAEIQSAKILNVSVKKGSQWIASKTYQMSVLNFRLDENDKKPFRWYTMKDEDGGELSGLLNVLFFELPKIKSLYGNPPEKLTKLEKWGLFLSCADDPASQEYLDRILKTEGGLMNAKKSLYEISEDERNWWIQNSIDTARRDYNDGLYRAEMRGVATGEHNKAIETARNLFSMGLSSEQIAQATGLSEEEVRSLQDN